MNTPRKLSVVWTILAAAALILASCTENSPLTDPADHNPNAMRLQDGKSPNQFRLPTQNLPFALNNHFDGKVFATLTYISRLCDSVPVQGMLDSGTASSSALWHYYGFYADSGATISINVSRTGCSADPAFSLYQGIATETDGIDTTNGGVQLTWLAYQNDDVAPTLACGCGMDPQLTGFVAPSTGYYTLAVFDVAGCRDSTDTTRGYSLVVTGISCNDADGDGVYDDVDNCDSIANPGQEDDDSDGVGNECDTVAPPPPDTVATIIIDGCDTGVPNDTLADGTTMLDHILMCAEGARNHGTFVSCVAHLTNGWKSDGKIDGDAKSAIQSCAARSHYGK